MLSYEKEFLASERLRERRVEAEHERLASRARQARRASEHGAGARPARFRVAIDFVRRLGRVAQAT